MVSRTFPIHFEKFKCDRITNLFWKNDTAIKLIYDLCRGTIKKYHIKALIIQLFVRGVFQIANVSSDGLGDIVIIVVHAGSYQL
jgi:hypothetical protein